MSLILPLHRVVYPPTSAQRTRLLRQHISNEPLGGLHPIQANLGRRRASNAGSGFVAEGELSESCPLSPETWWRVLRAGNACRLAPGIDKTVMYRGTYANALPSFPPDDSSRRGRRDFPNCLEATHSSGCCTQPAHAPVGVSERRLESCAGCVASRQLGKSRRPQRGGIVCGHDGTAEVASGAPDPASS